MLRKNIGLGIMAYVVMAGLAVSACDDDNDVVVIDARIDVIDVNDDLVVSLSEWTATFAVWDINGDGFLVDVEFLFNGTAFVNLDVNGDARLTVDEFNAAMDAWDINNDLVLEEAEFDAFL